MATVVGRLQAGNRRLLVQRLHLGDDLVDPDLFGHCLRGCGGIAGEQDRAQPIACSWAIAWALESRMVSVTKTRRRFSPAATTEVLVTGVEPGSRIQAACPPRFRRHRPSPRPARLKVFQAAAFGAELRRWRA